ncbi:MAG: transglutaminase family protein [Planctomycetales bacterium]|nr:transglutaminase family protein [Planctomycetales bacterium]
MTQIRFGSSLTYIVNQPTVFLFKIVAGWTPHQKVENESLTFDPLIEPETCQVGHDGNRIHRVVVQPCELNVNYQATVELTYAKDDPSSVQECPVAELPAEALVYMNPSRYCESDLLARFAIEEFGSLAQGYVRVQAICDWVYDHLDYTPGSTNTMTTAADVLLQRTGVCRDFAHLAIALCRGIGIPARYLSGYAANLQPPDFHGFMEAFLGDQWYLFDPTRLSSTDGLVRIGVGRDAADVAFATLTGSATLINKDVWANFCLPVHDGDPSSAISTA